MVLPFFVNFSFPIWKENRGFPETDNNYARKKDLLCHVWQLAELTKTRLTFGDRYCVPESYCICLPCLCHLFIFKLKTQDKLK